MKKMFFKKKRKIEEAVLEQDGALDQGKDFLPVSEEMDIVQQIHNSFDNAHLEILREAAKVLTQVSDKDVEIVDLHNELGFKNLSSKRKEMVTRLNLTQSSANHVNHYQQTYPTLKFLKIEQLDEICEKYGLIHACVDQYLKEVPYKNLIEIKNAPELKKKDRQEDIFKLHGIKDNALLEAIGHPEGEFTQQEIIDLLIQHQGYDVEDWTHRSQNTTWLFVVAQKYGLQRADHYSFKTVEHKEYSNKLFIAAPPSHFDLEGLDKDGKFGYIKKHMIEPKDPIVFRYVKGGIQVLSKWGEEASDPILINEKEN